jgi:hypothetical protein
LTGREAAARQVELAAVVAFEHAAPVVEVGAGLVAELHPITELIDLTNPVSADWVGGIAVAITGVAIAITGVAVTIAVAITGFPVTITIAGIAITIAGVAIAITGFSVTITGIAISITRVRRVCG